MSMLLRSSGVVGNLLHFSNRTTAATLNATISLRYVHHHMEREDLKRYIGLKRSNPQRANRNTHVNDKKWRKARGRKFIPVELPDEEFERNIDKLPPSEIRIAFLRRGYNLGKEVGSRDWQEQQLTLQSCYAILENFVPPDDPLPLLPGGSGRFTLSGKKDELVSRTKNKWHSWWNGVRRIKKKEGFKNFTLQNFCLEAQGIYVRAHEYLAKRDKNALLTLITEHAYEKMWPDVERGTLVWEHCEFKSPSKVVSVRCVDYPYQSGNDIAQIVVRMHTLQKYALYDRFGQLLLGSTEEPKECIEYVAFENHIAREDSMWRLHDKIYPQWAQVKDGIKRPTLLAALPAEERPEHAVPLKLSTDDRMQREEEAKKKKAEDGS